MKNSIYKSYAKKILKSQAFTSLVIVFILALGIIGTSYALYMDVDTDTDYQLVESGDLLIGFDNGDNTITLTNMTPSDDDIAIANNDNLFSFYIYNTGTYTTKYSIKLVEDLDEANNGASPNAVEPQYINYQICKDNKDNCEVVKTLGDDNTIYIDELKPQNSDGTNPSAYYFLRLWINNKYPYTTQKTIKYDVVIEAQNASGHYESSKTLSGAILNNSNITINNTQPIFNGIADYKTTGNESSGEPGLYKAEDDYGVSYYFRGAQSHNYVDFAGFIWRVVRINGDGTIRLILDGSLDLVKHKDESDYVYKNAALYALDTDGLVKFNENSDDNAYVGYMYGDFDTNSTSYDEAHSNINSSTIKTYIDTFYEQYLMSYQNHLADSIFCGDKTRGKNYTNLGFGQSATKYGVYDRLYNYDTKAYPTLKCADKKEIADTALTEAQLAYSRYTSKIDMNTTTDKGVLVNNDLTYPIGLLSADELVFAGGFKSIDNKSYYINDAYYYNPSKMSVIWYLNSPYSFSGRADYTSSLSINWSLNLNQNDGAVRPVINLKSDAFVLSGDGTKDYTYDEDGNVLTGPYNITIK